MNHEADTTENGDHNHGDEKRVGHRAHSIRLARRHLVSGCLGYRPGRHRRPPSPPARDTAVQVFSDWERSVRPGESVPPDSRFTPASQPWARAFPIRSRPPAATCSSRPRCADPSPCVRETLVRYVYDQDFRHEHSHDEDVASVSINMGGELDGQGAQLMDRGPAGEKGRRTSSAARLCSQSRLGQRCFFRACT